MIWEATIIALGAILGGAMIGAGLDTCAKALKEIVNELGRRM
jgi:hypothetical protein